MSFLLRRLQYVEVCTYNYVCVFALMYSKVSVAVVREINKDKERGRLRKAGPARTSALLCESTLIVP